MDEKTERAKLAAERRAAAEWERGFTACALLMSGRYEDYAVKRDKWLDTIDAAI
jgi:hypothetical protein